jgi:hypothetical protein
MDFEFSDKVKDRKGICRPLWMSTFTRNEQRYHHEIKRKSLVAIRSS